MGWFKKKVDASVVEELRNEIADLKNELSLTDSQAFKDMFLGGSQGVRVGNANTAMKLSVVFACVRLLGGAVSSSPRLIQKKVDRGGVEIADKHPFSKLLNEAPNEHITASVFWKTMTENKVLGGNAFAAITRSRAGRPIALTPIAHTRVTPYQAWELGLDKELSVSRFRLYYDIMWDDGTRSVFDEDDMLHIPNIGWDGKKGMSTIGAAGQAMGLGLSAEESASKLFENGLVSQAAISFPNKMDADQAELLRNHVAEKHSGSGNHHKPLVLTQGGDIKPLSLSAVDAQLLEARQYTVIDLCRFFGVFPVMVGESEKTSSWGSGVEQVARLFDKFSLTDHFTDIEQEVNKKIFRNSGHFVRFDSSQLTRGDTKTRAEYYKAALGGPQNQGWLTPDEVREEEGKPPKGCDEIASPQSNEKVSDEK